MSTLDVRMRATALRLIDKFGDLVSIVTATVGVYDVATGGAAVTTVTRVVKAVIGKPSRELKNGAWIEGEGASFTIAASSLLSAPGPNDKIVLAGVAYLVETVTSNYAGPGVVTYSLTAKKA